MSLSTYFDYIHTLLPDDQWEAYTSCCTTWVMRSLTRSWHRPRSQVSSLLESQGWSFSKPPMSVADNHRWVDREDKSVALGHHWWHLWGWYYIQESAASLPATLIDCQPDDVILDMCAAPWGKTSQLASNLLKLWGSGFVVANEIDNLRRSTLKENITRMWLYNVTVAYRHSSRRAEHYPSTFDHIVVDAPCSGEGTIFRTTEFMDQWGVWLTHKNAQIQKDIIGDAIACLKPWGTLIFSTCTLNTNENEWVVAWILENYGEQMELVPVNIQWSSPWLPWFGLSDEDCTKVARFWPHIQHTGGFWVSKFIKQWWTLRDDGTASSSQTPWSTTIPLTPKGIPSGLRGNKKSKIESCTSNNCWSRVMLKSQLGITLPEHTRVYEDKWFGYLTTTQKLSWFESGLPILKLGQWWITPLQPLIPALWHLSTLPRIDLNDEQIQQWMMNTQIELPLSPLTSVPLEDIKWGAEGGGVLGGGEARWGVGEGLKWRVIVSCHWFDVWLGKVGWGVLKNKM